MKIDSIIKRPAPPVTYSNLLILLLGFYVLSPLPCEAYYGPIDNSHPLVVCDSLNVDIQSLFALSQESLVFPNALAETRCVAINTCSEFNHRGEAVPANTWLHRSLASLQFDDEYDVIRDGIEPEDQNSYNHYSLDYARVPAGIRISACQPDFDHLRTSGEYICNPDPNATKSISGACPFNFPSVSTPQWPPNTVEFLFCLATLQRDSQEASLQDNAVWGSATYPIASVPGSTQMVYYEFEEGYGCYDASHLSPGLYLSSSMTPNRVLTCPELSIGTYTNDYSSECVFSCPTDYSIDTANQKCSHVCANVSSTACNQGYYASLVCDDASITMYTCTPCPNVPGKYSTTWNPQNPTQCVDEDCPAGTFSNNGVCEQCPINSFSNIPGQTSCALCPYGQYTEALGSTSCVECFSKDITGIQCQDGERLSANLTFIEQYFQTSATQHREHFTLETFCAQGYACLPCPPGHYEANGQCEQCHIATYQPNFKQTVCFSCDASKTTLQEGSATAEQCVCREGHE